MDMTKQSHSIFALNSHNFNEFFTLSGGARYEFSTYNTNRSYRNEMSMNGRPPSSNPMITDSTTLLIPIKTPIILLLKSPLTLNTLTQAIFILNTKEVLFLLHLLSLSIAITTLVMEYHPIIHRT